VRRINIVFDAKSIFNGTDWGKKLDILSLGPKKNVNSFLPLWVEDGVELATFFHLVIPCLALNEVGITLLSL